MGASEADPRIVVVDASELAPGETRRIEHAGREILLCNVDGAFHAVADRCTHAAFSLSGGRLEGCVVECPLHGARFDVRDGSVVRLPARGPLATFPVSVSGARVRIRVEPFDAGRGKRREGGT